MAEDKDKTGGRQTVEETALDPNEALKAARGANESAQRRADEETEKGYRGTVPDPFPNEAYTVAGATRGESPPAALGTARGLAARAEAAVASTAEKQNPEPRKGPKAR